MFSRNTRRERAAGIVEDAWHQLGSAFDTAESSARTAGRRAQKIYGVTAHRVESGGKEARERAQDAYAALLGRRQRRTPWGWLAVATATGAAVGWLVTTFGRKALTGPDSLTVTEPTFDEDLARIGS